jgi:hypothetical protein
MSKVLEMSLEEKIERHVNSGIEQLQSMKKLVDRLLEVLTPKDSYKADGALYYCQGLIDNLETLANNGKVNIGAARSFQMVLTDYQYAVKRAEQDEMDEKLHRRKQR